MFHVNIFDILHFRQLPADEQNQRPRKREKVTAEQRPFCKRWLNVDLLKKWMMEKNGQAYCKFCRSTITGTISHMFRHAESIKHTEMFNKIVQQPDYSEAAFEKT